MTPQLDQSRSSTITPRPAALAAISAGMLLAALAGAGCQNQAYAPGTVMGDPVAATAYPQVAVLEGLQGFIVTNRPPIVEAGPPLQVTFAARAKTEFEEISVQYRYFFFEASGKPLNPNPDWQYLRMPSRSEVFFVGNALDKTATNWRLEIRPAR
jgi:uncharacterized protein YcfL